MSQRPPADVCDDVGAYLLGALDDSGRARFEAHLATCQACRMEAEALGKVVDILPNAATPVDPPPELRDRIMSVVHAEAELLAAAGADADRPPAPRRTPGLFSRLFARPGLAAGVAAGVIAVAAAGGFAVGAITDSGGGGASAGRTVAAMVTPPAGPDASARVVVDGGRATLKVAGFKRPAPGREYQVWVTRRANGNPIPTTALFTTGKDGTATVEVPGDAAAVQKVLVTPEPRGGTRTGLPSTAPIVVASLA